MARAIVGGDVRPPERRTDPVDVDPLTTLHAKLKTISVELGPEPEPDDLRKLFSEIRRHRNMVSRIFGTFLPRIARYKADLLRVDSQIAAESAVLLYSEKGMALTKNEKQRTARVRAILSEHFKVQGELKEDLAALDAVLAHTRHVLDELRYAFEEASRSFTTVEFDLKLQVGRAEG